MKALGIVTVIGTLLTLIPQRYLPYEAAVLTLAIGIVHLMAEWQPTNAVWGQVAAVLNQIAGNYGKAANGQTLIVGSSLADPVPAGSPPQPSLVAKTLIFGLLSCGAIALSACGAKGPAAVLSAAGTDVTSELDIDVKSLTLVDQGLAIYVRLPLCAPGATFTAKSACSNASVAAKIQSDAHTARLKLEAAQADAAQATAALSLFASVMTEFTSL